MRWNQEEWEMDQIGEKVLVPVKLTDAMRERMARIEDGPAKSYDEVWAEMLDAALPSAPQPEKDAEV